MRNRKVLLGLACLAANTMLMSTAHADRRTGLGGNLLIEDADDLFPFPQYTLKHRNMLRADYGATSSSGNGVFTIGDANSAYGVSLHRGDILTPDNVGFATELAWLNGVQNPFTLGAFDGNASSAAVTPDTFIDFSYARSLGQNAFGLRLGFGRGADVIDNDGDVTGSSTTFITLQGGYSILPEDGLNLDLSGNVMFALGSTQAGGDDLHSGNRIRLGLLARGYYPVNDLVDIGFLGQLSGDREGQERDQEPGPGVESSRLDVNLLAGVGPVINLERMKLATYGGLLFGFGTDEPDGDTDDDETTRIRFAVPTVRMSGEVQLLDWMYVRTGLDYLWNLNSSAIDDVSTRTANGAFQWNAGLGVTKNNFSLDGVVQNSFLTSGPTFIGGNATGFMAMASMTYKFGDVLSGEGVAPQEEGAVVEPAPVEPPPAPPVEPAPVQEEAAPAVEGDATGTTTTTDTSIGVGGTVGGTVGTP